MTVTFFRAPQSQFPLQLLFPASFKARILIQEKIHPQGGIFKIFAQIRLQELAVFEFALLYFRQEC